MSYDVVKSSIGNKPLIVTDLYLDFCGLTYNSSVTNLLSGSEDFSSSSPAIWVPPGGAPTITVNTHVAPDGLQTADTIEDTNTSSPEYIGQTVSIDGTKYYTADIFVLKDNTPRTTRFFQLSVSYSGGTGSPNSAGIRVDTKTGDFALVNGSGPLAVKYLSGDVVDYGDYWRSSIITKAVKDDHTTFAYYLLGSYLLTDENDWTSISNTSGSMVVWGSQLVEGSETKGYVKTTTSSASKTCAASQSSGLECYNTRKTCQDTTNYTKIIKKYQYCQSRSNLPKGINMIPCIKNKPDFAPSGAPVYGVGSKGKITITMQDFPHNDRGVDPYVDNRSYNPSAQGTYWGKLISRNPYYLGRSLIVRSGYISDPFSWEDFQERRYIIDRIDGPDSNGIVKIIGVDTLRLIDDDYTQIPAPSEGLYVSGLGGSPLTIVVTTGKGVDYGSSGKVKIGKTIYGFTGRTADTLTGITIDGGSEASAPSVGDTVQLCKVHTSENVVDIVYEYLNTWAGIPSSNIPYSNGSPQDEWDLEKSNWLTSYNLTTIIHEPTGLKTLLEELCEQCQFSLFVDQVSNKIKLISNTPPLGTETVTELTDNANLLSGSINIKDDTKSHITRVSFSYDKINFAEGDETTNYRTTLFSIDASREDQDLYNVTRLKPITSRWFNSSNVNQVSQVTNRIKDRHSEPLKIARFSLHAKDSGLWTGDIVDITSRFRQDHDGSNRMSRYQVVSVDEDESVYHYTAVSSQFTGRFAFIADNALAAASPQVTYDTASSSQKEANAFIGITGANFADGEPAYKII